MSIIAVVEELSTCHLLWGHSSQVFNVHTRSLCAEPLLPESMHVFVMLHLCKICAQYRYNMRKGGSGSFIFYIKYHAFTIYISFVKVPITEHIYFTFFNIIILSHVYMADMRLKYGRMVSRLSYTLQVYT